MWSQALHIAGWGMPCKNMVGEYDTYIFLSRLLILYYFLIPETYINENDKYI